MCHTPLPWSVHAIFPDSVLAEETNVCQCWNISGQGEANAAFIVRAVNCHEELLATLKAVRQRLHFVGHPSEPIVDGLLMPRVGDWRKEIALIEAAITKAKGL